MSWLSVEKGADYRWSGRGGASARARSAPPSRKVPESPSSRAMSVPGALRSSGSTFPGWLLRACMGLTVAGCAPAPPAVNAAQAHILRIHGLADPSLTIQVSTRYLTAAKKCRRAANLLRRLDGAAAPLAVRVNSPVERIGTEDYEARVVLDYFEPGKCGWHPFSIGFQVSTPQGVSTGQVITDEDGVSRNVPGPESKVWIDAAVQHDSSPGTDRPEGATYIRPLELQCREHSLRGATILTCVPEGPRELALISEEATEVRVDFKDMTER